MESVYNSCIKNNLCIIFKNRLLTFIFKLTSPLKGIHCRNKIRSTNVFNRKHTMNALSMKRILSMYYCTECYDCQINVLKEKKKMKCFIMVRSRIQPDFSPLKNCHQLHIRTNWEISLICDFSISFLINW